MLDNPEQAAEQTKIEGGNIYGIPHGTYVKHLILFCILYACFSFCYWLIDFQMEYIGTDIFVLFYLNGIVIMLSGEIIFLIYPWLGMKYTVITAQALTLITAILLLMVHEKVIGYEDEEEEERFFNIMIPGLLLFLTLAI